MPARPRLAAFSLLRGLPTLLANPRPRPCWRTSLNPVGCWAARDGPYNTKTSNQLRRQPVHRRAYSSRHSETAAALAPVPPARWWSDLRARIGKCLIFGCSAEQTQQAAVVLRALATEWRDLTAGSEGFLTGGRGLEDHRIAWGEMDSFQHVNNVNYARYAESGRVSWMTHFAVNSDAEHRRAWAELMTPRSIGLIMKSLKIDFKLPITYPDTISVYHRLRHAPAETDTALILDCVILSHRHRRVAARTEEEVTVYDYRVPGKTAVPGFMHDKLAETYRLQREEAARARGRIQELAGLVRALEEGTWDRVDAVEDNGGRR